MQQLRRTADRFSSVSKRLAHLLRLASEYTAAQLAARVLAAISGLMLVRLLPVSEYGFYTLVLAAFTFICTFSDLGATETLSFFRWRGGKKNKPWMPYFHAVLRFRRTVFVFGFISSAAYIFYTGRHIGVDTKTILGGVALMGLAAWFAIQSGIISYVLKLEQRFRQAYAVELSNEGIKLLAVGLIWILGFATALAGMTSVALGALIAAILATGLLGQRFAKGGTITRRRERHNSRMLLGQIMPILPGTIHFALQGPLIVSLAAYYGSVVNVAEIGALGRLGVLIGVVTGFTGTVFVPRLLVISDEALFLKRYWHWWLVMLTFGGIMMLAVFAFPDMLLYLLGSSYSGLHTELVISAATAIIATWGAFSWHINRARGWIQYQTYRVPVIVAGQIPMFFALDLSTTPGVLLFSLGSMILDSLFQTLISVQGFFFLHIRIRPITHA